MEQEIEAIIREHAHHFLMGLKTEYDDDKQALFIIRKYIRDGQVTGEEEHVLRTQLADSLKIIGIGIPFILIPGASILMPVLISEADKYHIELMPSAFTNPDDTTAGTNN